MTNPNADDFEEFTVGYTNDTGEEVEDIELVFPSDAAPTDAPAKPARIINWDENKIEVKASSDGGPGGDAKGSALFNFNGKTQSLGSVNLTLGVGQTFQSMALDAAKETYFDFSAAEELSTKYEEIAVKLGFDTTATATIKALLKAEVVGPHFVAMLQASTQTGVTTIRPNNTVEYMARASLTYKSATIEGYGTVTGEGSISKAFRPGTDSYITKIGITFGFKSIDYHFRRATWNIGINAGFFSTTTENPRKSVTINDARAGILGSVDW